MNVKYKHPIDFKAEFKRLEAGGQFVLVNLEPQHVLDFDADATVPEMHDRIIVGVARRLNAACITKDDSIARSGLVKVIW